MNQRLLVNAAWLAAYALTMAALLYVLVSARPALIAAFSTREAQSDWQQFVDEAKRQSTGDGPVARRVPKSAEPPTLVLMRDYFATCVAGTLLFGSALFVVMMFLVRGVFSKQRGAKPQGTADTTNAPTHD